jgi:CHAT domain-containing protein
VLAVNAGGATLHRLPDRSAIEPLVPVFLGLVQRRDGSEAAAARRLFTLLLAAPLAALPASTERLVIVPDGALFSLPFDVLQPAAAGAPPVGARYELAVVPSATALLHWRGSAPAPASHGALVLADPTLPAGAAVATVRDGSLGDAVALGALPAARREGRALIRLLGPTSELLEGAAATERALARPDLGSFAVLHLAAHAVADGVHPQRSAVLLAAADAREDGLLQGREITRLPLAGRTVFLSACRTAAGAVAAGEGPLSLARAFQQAGARAVIGSRWPLRDDEAAVLVAEVYRHLAAGRSLGAALLAARRDAWESGRPAATWAALVLMGEPDVEVFAGLPLPRPRSDGRALLAALLLLLVAALAGGVYHRRVRRESSATSQRSPAP